MLVDGTIDLSHVRTGGASRLLCGKAGYTGMNIQIAASGPADALTDTVADRGYLGSAWRAST